MVQSQERNNRKSLGSLQKPKPKPVSVHGGDDWREEGVSEYRKSRTEGIED